MALPRFCTSRKRLLPPKSGRPARATSAISDNIASALPSSVFARYAAFYFDGGDFLADGETVFVGSRVLPRNIQCTEFSKETFVRDVASTLKRRVVLFDEAPDHHVAMFMAAVGNQTVLVGGPSLGRTCCRLQFRRTSRHCRAGRISPRRRSICSTLSRPNAPKPAIAWCACRLYLPLMDELT